MNILILNGPNLNLLDKRPDEHYGSLSLAEIENAVRMEFPNHQFEFFQSNHEGELIDKIQSAANSFSGLIINPGGYSHTSVAIKDALEICSVPKVEVHLSNLAARETFRQNMLTASSCDGYISGFREKGYLGAIYLLEKMIS
ncbi:MAG: 3-dehydroquinate dehydratase [Ignavibacteriaceae bacterium]|jgi:3-dehydroquinate dehydratase-2|nr:3-dehydroquinate dehydratase [Ignavibacteriaceae bacterium]